jgi:hypothetical protein
MLVRCSPSSSGSPLHILFPSQSLQAAMPAFRTRVWIEASMSGTKTWTGFQRSNSKKKGTETTPEIAFPFLVS